MFDIMGLVLKRYCNLLVLDYKNVIFILDVNGVMFRMFNIMVMVLYGYYKFFLFISYMIYIMYKIIILYGYIWVKIGMVNFIFLKSIIILILNC